MAAIPFENKSVDIRQEENEKRRKNERRTEDGRKDGAY
jgi:hypothetical protein